MSIQVLCVDDNHTQLNSLENILCRLFPSFVIEKAYDAKNALKKVTEQSFDLVVTDMNMPRYNGIWLIQQIRQQFSKNTLPILVLSQESFGDTIIAASNAGANCFVAKYEVSRASTPQIALQKFKKTLKQKVESVLRDLNFVEFLLQQGVVKPEDVTRAKHLQKLFSTISLPALILSQVSCEEFVTLYKEGDDTLDPFIFLLEDDVHFELTRKYLQLTTVTVIDILLMQKSILPTVLQAARERHELSLRTSFKKHAPSHDKKKAVEIPMDQTALNQFVRTAVRNGHIDRTKQLIADGANVESIDKNGVSLLMKASAIGCLELVTLLIDEGAKINHKSKQLWQPITYAVFNGHEPIVHYLIQQGAEVHNNTKDGSSLLDIAFEHKYTNIQSALHLVGVKRCKLVNK
ncbi:response regulator [Acanthopleuribacter pedis]|uniref:Response regulator n=1 Tax=Acanthopleuribacter pedis TaxID=442870 RepID=A0A8J7QCQ0_9BACT|nr:response regulator [Acanthopleuribacter pedis]MBO1323281.1 response regulator [Acanthopleuribacter pedis]